MEIAATLFAQIALMFLLMMAGTLLFKTGKISPQGSKDMGSILLYLVIPAAIINSFLVERTPENLNALWQSALISAMAMLIACLISWLFFGKRDGIACFSAAFSNAAFMGIPMIQAAIGAEAVFFISMMIVLVNALQWTFGLYVMTGDKSAMSPGRLKTNPVILAVIAGLIILLTGIPIGTFPRKLFFRSYGAQYPAGHDRFGCISGTDGCSENDTQKKTVCCFLPAADPDPAGDDWGDEDYPVWIT